MTDTFTDKTVLVTGGNSGLGLGAARRFVEQGATVFIAARRKEALEQAQNELGERAVAVQCDITVRADLDRLFATIEERAGTLDVVVANAGGPFFATIESYTEQTLDDGRWRRESNPVRGLTSFPHSRSPRENHGQTHKVPVAQRPHPCDRRAIGKNPRKGRYRKRRPRSTKRPSTRPNRTIGPTAGTSTDPAEGRDSNPRYGITAQRFSRSLCAVSDRCARGRTGSPTRWAQLEASGLTPCRDMAVTRYR